MIMEINLKLETFRLSKLDVTYTAGGAILRMLEAVLGQETYQKALKIYLTKNAYGSATQNTLIEAFEEVNWL
jgi:aminopeptidase N